MVIAMVNEEQIRISPNAAKEIQENSETLEGAAPSPAPTSSQADKSGEGSSDLEKEKQKQEYNAYIKQMAPSKNLFWQMCKAFLVGGLFCVLGQFILNTCKSMGLEKETAGSWTSLLLILLSVILTGFHLYQCIHTHVWICHKNTGHLIHCVFVNWHLLMHHIVGKIKIFIRNRKPRCIQGIQ